MLKNTGIIIIIIAVCYHIFWYLIIPRNVPVENADAIVVFPGNESRYRAAYQLVRQGYARKLIITSGGAKHTCWPIDAGDIANLLTYFACGQARSTFEDALFTQKLVVREGFTRIILVTDDYHLPRAAFLLRMMLARRNVTVFTHRIPPEIEPVPPRRIRYQLLFNERIKFLGSLMEMGLYRITGILINDYDGLRQLKEGAKRLVLFDV